MAATTGIPMAGIRIAILCQLTPSAAMTAAWQNPNGNRRHKQRHACHPLSLTFDAAIDGSRHCTLFGPIHEARS
jgi:hypothetical protein